MPILATGVPVAVPEPSLQVENQFQPGVYQFELICVDEAGNESSPARIAVTVRPPPIIVDPAPTHHFDPSVILDSPRGRGRIFMGGAVVRRVGGGK
jgi:hypothetical protein